MVSAVHIWPLFKCRQHAFLLYLELDAFLRDGPRYEWVGLLQNWEGPAPNFVGPQEHFSWSMKIEIGIFKAAGADLAKRHTGRFRPRDKPGGRRALRRRRRGRPGGPPIAIDAENRRGDGSA